MSRGSLRRVYDDNSALLTEMKSTERYKRAVERMQKESHGSARPRCSRRWRSGRSASAQLRKPLKHHRDISNLGHLHAPRRERRGDRYGFRIIARKTGAQVMLYSRPGNDLTRRFPLIIETLARLRSRSCIIDGEAVACDDIGVASFDRAMSHQRPMFSFCCVSPFNPSSHPSAGAFLGRPTRTTPGQRPQHRR